MNVHELMSQSEPHINIVNAFAKAWDVLGRYRKPVISISGGADSDIVLDMIHKLDDEHKAIYLWLNTGLEYQATRRHLDFLEAKYSIDIKRVVPIKPIPIAVYEAGYPFISKIVSQLIHSLQIHSFNFSSGNSYETDKYLYTKCRSAVKWWHSIGSYSTFNINRYKLLREFLTEYPPQFSISAKCCDYAKKLPAEHFMKDIHADLKVLGMRKAEGGIRQSKQNCFTTNNDYATFNPIFYFSNEDRTAYEKIFGITHSDCYSVYGLKRTGCAGCPYNPTVFDDLEKMKVYEPGLAQAAEKVFAPAYEYTKKFQQYRFSHSGRTMTLFQEGDEA